jgi:hypothetical protein
MLTELIPFPDDSHQAVATIRDLINRLHAPVQAGLAPEQYERLLGELGDFDSEHFGGFAAEGAAAYDAAKFRLSSALEQAKARVAGEAKAKAERAAKDAQARHEAELRERELAEREREVEAEKRIQQALRAEASARQAAAIAEGRERRAAAEAQAEAAAQIEVERLAKLKRERDVANKARIHDEILYDLDAETFAISRDDLSLIVDAIADNRIRHVRIEY